MEESNLGTNTQQQKWIISIMCLASQSIPQINLSPNWFAIDLFIRALEYGIPVKCLPPFRNPEDVLHQEPSTTPRPFQILNTPPLSSTPSPLTSPDNKIDEKHLECQEEAAAASGKFLIIKMTF